LTTELRLYRSGYTTSIVTVFAGNVLETITSELASKIRNSAIEATVEIPPQGFLTQWADGLSLISRTQGPDRQRLETRAQGPDWPGYEGSKVLLTELLAEHTTDRTAVTFGVNSTMSLLGPRELIRSQLSKYFESDSISTLLRRKHLFYGETSFGADVLDSRLTVKLTPSTLLGRGEFGMLVVDTNFSRPVEPGKELLEYISDDKLKKYSDYANALFSRFERGI